MKDLLEGLLVLVLMTALVFINAHTAEIKRHIWPEPAPAIEQPVASVSPQAAPPKLPYGTDALTGIKVIHDMDSAYLVPIIKDALRLLKAKDPEHYALVSRYVTAIEVRDAVPDGMRPSTNAWATPEQPLCVFLHMSTLPKTIDKRIMAGILVHEAVHCRQIDEGRVQNAESEAEAYLTAEIALQRLGVTYQELAAIREAQVEFLSTPCTPAARD